MASSRTAATTPPGITHYENRSRQATRGFFRRNIPGSFVSLCGSVAFAGSQCSSPFPMVAAVHAVLSSDGWVRVGRTVGVDATVRACCPSSVVVTPPPLSGLLRTRLATRTRVVVAEASALCVFSPAGSVLGLGSARAVRSAFRQSITVWCAGRRRPSVPASWPPLRLAHLTGWACFPESRCVGTRAPPGSGRACSPDLALTLPLRNRARPVGISGRLVCLSDPSMAYPPPTMPQRSLSR